LTLHRYFNEDELTREALTSDGWFMTGDIGQVGFVNSTADYIDRLQWNADGTLSIIDRVKNLVSGGVLYFHV
jgi:long-chain acyl-CoA synthetase